MSADKLQFIDAESHLEQHPDRQVAGVLDEESIVQSHYNPSEERWHKNYELLAEFKKKNGHCRPKCRTGLGMWAHNQRVCYKRGSLSEDRIQKLHAIGFEWEARESVWEDKYLLLVEFKKENGHCRPKQSNSLGRWVSTQQNNYKRGGSSEDQIEKLNDIGFEWQARIHRLAVCSAMGKASDYDSQRSDDNDLPQQQQTAAAMTATGTLKQPFTPTPQDVTSQPFAEMDDGNGDSNICEEFFEIETYGNSECFSI